MPTPALLLLIATLLPLASFLVLVFLGRRLGRPLAGIVGTAAIAMSFCITMGALYTWVAGSEHPAWGKDRGPINIPIRWLPVGQISSQDHPGFLDLGIYVDSLTVLMFVMVSLVSTLIHVFSIGYMADDRRFPRFFTYLSLFCFSMLGLVLGGTLLQLFIFWELVGLCSYLLIGFWHERKSASNAAIKAFITNRVGDVGFLIGLGILFHYLGNVTLPDVWASLDASRIVDGGIRLGENTWIPSTVLTLMGIALFCGAVGKSAQFPLHVWLPDAMEGPTPVSALIHAATMVAAGVYLVARIFPILTPEAKLFISIIGVTTLTMAALIAVVQSDIKKVLAYSTVSQLGYMILAMGVGSWVGGLFHLITHAFFKALLFLGAGSVIHACHHQQEMAQYGGLWRKLPWTAMCFAIAVLTIAGTPFLSAYYSKDMIVAHVGATALLAARQGASGGYWVFFILPTAVAYLTAFYMTRCWMLTFAGSPRNPGLYKQAREHSIMWPPLVVLALLSVFSGRYLFFREMIDSAREETNRYYLGRSIEFGGFRQAWPAVNPSQLALAESAGGEEIVDKDLSASQRVHERGWHLAHQCLTAAPWLGILLGVLIYWNGYQVADVLMRLRLLRWIHTWLYRRMYFDELYMGVFVAVTIGLARLGEAIDRYVLDGIVHFLALVTRRLAEAIGWHDLFVVDGAVNGVAVATHGIGAAARAGQTGRIRLYVTSLLGMITLGVAAAVGIVSYLVSTTTGN